MRKFLTVILFLFLASTMVMFISCGEKEEAMHAPAEEHALPEYTPPVPTEELAHPVEGAATVADEEAAQSVEGAGTVAEEAAHPEEAAPAEEQH
ncbi:MAG: hypothetical protein JRF64_06545 [Deltaproteobacteria bacterium]|nr:hypothetical protein [Deltaproteobacteria bacterium]